MSKFSLDKRGYNPEEVDAYINNLYLKYEDKLSEQKDRVFALKNELDKSNAKLNDFIEKDKQISKALMYAVEKADEIESGSKKIYELEIQRVRLLYKRWEELLIEVENRYPQLNTNNDVRVLLKTFKDSLNDVLESNFSLKSNVQPKKLKDDLKNKKDNNYIKNVLNKMNYVVNDSSDMRNAVVANKLSEIKKVDSSAVAAAKVSEIKKVDSSEFMAAHNKEASRLNSIANRLNNLTNLGANKGAVLEDFLNSDTEEEFSKSAYAKNLVMRKKQKAQQPEDWPFNFAYPEPNESGFDLKEALNPKEDLNEIMKTFDFFGE